VGVHGLSDSEFDELLEALAPDVREFELPRPLALPDLVEVMLEVWADDPDGKTHTDTTDEEW